MPLVQRMSFTATGMPSRGERLSPRESFVRQVRLFQGEFPGRGDVGLSRLSFSSILANTDSVISRELTSLFLSIRASSEALRSQSSIAQPSRIFGTLKKSFSLAGAMDRSSSGSARFSGLVLTPHVFHGDHVAHGTDVLPRRVPSGSQRTREWRSDPSGRAEPLSRSA